MTDLETLIAGFIGLLLIAAIFISSIGGPPDPMDEYLH
jgi:hypothetical protein